MRIASFNIICTDSRGFMGMSIGHGLFDYERAIFFPPVSRGRLGELAYLMLGCPICKADRLGLGADEAIRLISIVGAGFRPINLPEPEVVSSLPFSDDEAIDLAQSISRIKIPEMFMY
jgi:hypothetical protein